MMGCWVSIGFHLLNYIIWFNMNFLMSMFSYVLVFKWMLKGSAVCEHIHIYIPSYTQNRFCQTLKCAPLTSPCVRFQIEIIVAERNAASIHVHPHPCEVQCMCWYFYHKCSRSILSVLFHSNWTNSQTETTVNMLNIALCLCSVFFLSYP